MALTRETVAGLPRLSVIDSDILGQDGVAEWDPLKLCVDVTGLGISGYQAKTWLDAEQPIVPSSATPGMSSSP